MSATLPQAWLARCRATPAQVAMRHKRRGIWQSASWRDFFEAAQAIGLALHRLGLQPGEVVSIISESRPEWLYADMAAQAMGFLSHGVYPTESARRAGAQLAMTGSRAVFVENAAQAAKVLGAPVPLPRLKHVIVFDEHGTRALGDPRVLSLAALMAPSGPQDFPAFEARIAAGQRESLAFLATSAGTRGEPRIAAFTHAAAMQQGAAMRTASGAVDGDRILCFAPLANAAERALAGILPVLSDCLVHFPESPATVVNDLREVEPDWVHGPPRFWEKLRARTESAALLAPARERRLYQRSVDGGARGWLARAARRQLRGSLGLARARRVLCGGALAAPTLARWYAGIGLSLIDLYESVETCGPCVLDPGTARRADDGELQIRSPARLAGYWRGGAALEPPAFTCDGWLRTGDVAVRDPAGGLRAAGRGSDAFVMNSGERVAPEAVEAALLDSSYIAGAMLVGAERDHCACLVALEEDSVLCYAQSLCLPFTGYANLVARTEVRALVQAQIEQVNATLAGDRRILRFGVLPRTLSPQDESLTPTLRFHRPSVHAGFPEHIDALYAK